MLLAVLVGTAGCGWPDRSGVAEDIDAAIAAMPGVAATTRFYNTSFDGGAHFRLGLTFTSTVSESDAAAVGQAFVDKVRAGRFDNFVVRLSADYGKREIRDTMPYSIATFDVSWTELGGLSAGDVGDDLALWVRTSRSPAVTAMQIDRGRDSDSITVYASPSASDAELARLGATPELSGASWGIALASPEQYGIPRIYRRDTAIDQRTMATWQQIVDLLGPHDRAKATTADTPRASQPRTTADIVLDVTDHHELNTAAARFRSLVEALGSPAQLSINSPVGTVQFP